MAFRGVIATVRKPCRHAPKPAPAAGGRLVAEGEGFEPRTAHDGTVFETATKLLICREFRFSSQ
jgi:hypothetical protein